MDQAANRPARPHDLGEDAFHLDGVAHVGGAVDRLGPGGADAGEVVADLAGGDQVARLVREGARRGGGLPTSEGLFDRGLIRQPGHPVRFVARLRGPAE